MPIPNKLIALDYGLARIGVAKADSSIRIAVPLTTLNNDGTEIEAILKLAQDEAAELIIVGYPRNQQGEATEQTKLVDDFASKLREKFPSLVFQDESLTSVIAEDKLKASGKSYEKADIDSLAAAIILQDYLESHA